MVKYIKQKCPGCGRMVDHLWSWKKSFDSCAYCNPYIKGRELKEVLHDLNEKRKKESKKRKQK
jgi:hypothetical protein